MKKFIIITIIGLILIGCQSTESFSKKPDIHTAQISVDWNGTYYGEIPSASGSGIIVRITLTEDETYELGYWYIDRPENLYQVSGPFTWRSDGTTITLEGLDNYPKYYFISADHIIQLDMEGRRITGNLADRYILKKE